MKLFIAFSAYDSMKMHTVNSLVNTVRRLPFPNSFNFHRGPYVARNREMLLTDAVKGEYTHLMFIDCDVMFPPDGIERLIAREKDLIGAAYNLRNMMQPGTVEVQRISAVKLLGGKRRFPTMDAPFRCDTVPTGFMLVRLEPFLNIERPWFETAWTDEGFMGEDTYFCRRAREHGIDVWCDPTIPVGHVGEFIY